jgi:hypothetical protein
VSLNIAIEPVVGSVAGLESETAVKNIPASPRIERWLHAHLHAVALAITAGGFVARIIAANRAFLNPDEALHYLLINEPSLLLAYKASLTNAHPPLVFVVLYFWHFLGHSELMLRLPLVIAGTAFCWFLFKWTRELLGEPASLIALIIAAFSPTLVTLSAEVRDYALMLFGVAAAPYFLEMAFARKSVGKMWSFSLFLYFAILSHYSVALFALALGIYAFARIADSRLPRTLIAAWVIGEVGALAIYCFLYLTHLSRIRTNLAIWANSFGDTLFRLDEESLFHFTWQNTWNIFLYLFAQPYVAAALLIAFLGGIALFISSDLASARRSASRHMALLFVLPFVVIWLAAIARIYPYVGSRHTTVLAPFAIAAASACIAFVCRKRLWTALLLAALLMAVSNAYGSRPEPGIVENDRHLMTDAVTYLRQSIQQRDVILADMESTVTLAYYYCGTQPGFFTNWSRVGLGQFNCDGHLIVPLQFWYLTPAGLASPFEHMVRANDLKPGDRVWVFQSGWGGNLIAKLPDEQPRFRCLAPKTFGSNITVVPLIVGPDLAPAPQTYCQN